ncbi:S49 family peptidase [Candidatus Cytomitobacter indipagum]|nr:S49 family peptidase [Candidatus Cytomitobacter indipagum]
MRFIRNFLFVLLGLLSFKSTYELLKCKLSNNLVLTYGFNDSYVHYYQFDQLILALKNAANDSKIRGVAINYRNGICINGDSLTSIEELIDVFDLFKKNNKFVDLYIDGLDSKTAYLASHVNSTLCESASSYISGIHVYMPFARDALRRKGIDITTIATGEFKNPDPESRTEMSDEYREGLEQLIKVLSDIVIDKIKLIKKVDDIDTIMGLRKNDYICDLMSFKKGNSFSEWRNKYKKQISINKYVSMHSNKSSRNKIAIINIFGTISNESYLGSVEFMNKIEKIANNKDIKAVILRIDSGGGAVGLSYELYNILKSLSAKKLLVSSISDTCASGAYLIALSADKIFAPSVSVVGSIGVYMKHAHIKEPGVNIESINSHNIPDINNRNSPLDDRLKKDLIKDIRDSMNRFRQLVADRRSFTFEYSRQISLGQVYAGKDAAKLRLIDKEGTLLDALNFVQNKQKLSDYEIVWIA